MVFVQFLTTIIINSMTLDITFDLETCALCPTAAVLSLGAVAWTRDGDDSPFIQLDGKDDHSSEYLAHVDLRSSFLDGFTFDQDTANWWSKQSEAAKRAVLADDEEGSPCLPVEIVVGGFFLWIDKITEDYNADDVNLWCQGSDFDIAILRNICNRYHLAIPVKYTNFRDHRTFFIEGARLICDKVGVEFDPKKAYKMVEEYDGKNVPHDPIFDCKRSIYSTWQMMRQLKGIH